MCSRQVYVSDLVTVDDIARRYKMSVGEVTQYVRGKVGRRKVKFPQPLVGKGTRAVWLLSDIEDWHDGTLPKQYRDEKRALRKSA